MPHLIRMRWGMGSAPAEIDVCAATRRERGGTALECIRDGGRLTVVREWSEGGFAFGEYSADVDHLHRDCRADLLEMGRECFEICRAQGCEGIPPFKVGCFYTCDAWHAECPQAAADLRSRWRKEAKVVRMRDRIGCSA